MKKKKLSIVTWIVVGIIAVGTLVYLGFGT
ncbi:hypothetical protein JOF46_000334 [Paeniglutamicibacter psychrophenolicus]|uniref:Uncharacterized protein n=1 Tax=Paeniglutamicibacter psychrophenolicus TaxID=257454 RepID=A0ABS4W8A1_9MICC|nr:hypothetical protein [Paeniglutamicibacter psychrophenolicus]